MTKIQICIFVDAEDVDFSDSKKLIVKKGGFYFQGVRYAIEDKKIVPQTVAKEAHDELPF